MVHYNPIQLCVFITFIILKINQNKKNKLILFSQTLYAVHITIDLYRRQFGNVTIVRIGLVYLNKSGPLIYFILKSMQRAVIKRKEKPLSKPPKSSDRLFTV